MLLSLATWLQALSPDFGFFSGAVHGGDVVKRHARRQGLHGGRR